MGPRSSPSTEPPRAAHCLARSLPPDIDRSERPKRKALELQPQLRRSSPSRTPSWPRRSPAAGRRGDQPGWPSSGGEKPEKEGLANKSNGQKLIPAPAHITEQPDGRHHHQQGLGGRGEGLEGAAKHDRSNLPTAWLERTAANKRRYEDDSENMKAENIVAPKKLREGFKSEIILGGGAKSP